MLFLTKSDYEKMLAHCKEGLPNEACGLIGGVVEGEKQYVKKVYLLTNMDESNEHFSMDPKEQLAAVKDMRKMAMCRLAISILIRSLHRDHRRRTNGLPMIPRQII